MAGEHGNVLQAAAEWFRRALSYQHGWLGERAPLRAAEGCWQVQFCPPCLLTTVLSEGKCVLRVVSESLMLPMV